ncbi:PTS sugar transporter subunit IIA domain-containing protein [Lacticaseibacillus songhuajiangensis]|jgi:PTS system N-acetylgalactosamine-specific IIA component|uniref:PTS sugar transporter subunit IIA domain-containing protein n=1 Tax=Lacticaseibacillus songhuajiangensis TaxID=1296539 RepID=UPI000F7BA5E3|nr:PTS sugar transporter [Lacticaseibacillus songhuajiangensis]
MAKIHTIITGHGNFASGMRSSVKLLAGVPDNFDFLDFTENMSEEDVSAKLDELNASGEPLLVFADLLGGTPYKCAAKLAVAHPEQDIAVVAGCNLASLLETMFDDYANASEYANALVDATKRAAQVLDLTPDEPEEDTDEDGI